MCYATTTLDVLALINHILIFGIFVWGGYTYIRLKSRVVNTLTSIRVKMNCDELIDQLLEQKLQPTVCSKSEDRVKTVPESVDKISACTEKRERLAALAAGGQIKQYLGRSLTVDQVDDLPEDVVEKLYVRYEARLGAAMTKTLGTAFCQLFVVTVSMFLPIPPENHQNLVHNLESDLFVEHALNTTTCELYHRYGMFLAPLTAVLHTFNNCQFKQTCSSTISEHDENTSDIRVGGKDNEPGCEDERP
jgi:hypothetical protein